MGHDGVASGYPTPTDFCRLTGFQRDPLHRGVILSASKNVKFRLSRNPTKFD